jgi:two-component system, cell cycle response regulator
MAISTTDLFLQLADVMPLGIYVIDGGRNIIFWNQVAQQISGYQAQEVVGRNCCSEGLLAHCSLNGELLCPKGRCPMTLTLRDGNPKRAAMLLRHKDGHRVRIIVQTVPIRDEEGKISAVGQVFQLESFVAGLLWNDPNLALHSHAEMHSPEQTAEQLRLHWYRERDRLSAFLITVEGLQEMRANQGSAMVQTLLQTVAKTIADALWAPHYLGTWTDQRFILLVPQCDLSCREEILRELQASIGACAIAWWGDRIIPKIQIQTASGEAFKSPEKLLSSLDPEWRESKPLPGDD